MSNENLVWMSLGIWILFIVVLGYFALFGPTTATKVPSGNQVTTGGGVS
jgi:hypothetical protein